MLVCLEYVLVIAVITVMELRSDYINIMRVIFSSLGTTMCFLSKLEV